MATPDELKSFIAKRGFDVDVVQKSGSYIISIHSKTADDVASLLASIGEPGRFIVTVKLDDIIPTIGNILNVPKLKEDTDKLSNSIFKLKTQLEEDMHGNMKRLSETDAENKRQVDESLSLHTKRLDAVENKASALSDDMKYVKQQPWWKRFLGVK